MSDEKYMLQALDLARLGGRAVAPNPMVGAVIVKDGKVIGEGYHKKFGNAHAEVNAVKSVKNKSDLVGATIYVTLEPCRHYGKTPACLNLLQNVGIQRIVCGSHDPFQQDFRFQISDFRFEFLKGSIAKQCKQLNKFFFTWVMKKRPFITVKIAMSADSFVADGGSKPIRFTTAEQDREVHQLRADHQAIMVGINTILNDDPRLDVRLVNGKDPLRIILDSKLRTPKKAKILKDKNYLIATAIMTNNQFPMTNVWLSPTKKQISLKKLFAHLATIGISSVLVEPGPTLYHSLKKQGLIDELIVYRGRKKIGDGLRINI